MSWSAISGNGQRTGRAVARPFLWMLREEWNPIVEVDEMSSDLRTLDLLSMLIIYQQPKVIVEIGTYRGLGAATFAEALRTYEMDGHVYTCDPVDYEVPQFLETMGLTKYATYHQGTFETLLRTLPGPIDFCYVDGAATDDIGGRLRYARLAMMLGSPNCVVAVDDAAGDWKGAKAITKASRMFLPQHRGLALFQKR